MKFSFDARRTGIVACVLFTIAIAVGFLFASPHPLDDQFVYQAFVEKLAAFKLDLTIPGFHGSDFLAVPIFWLTHSAIAQIELQILCALLLPTLALFAGYRIYHRYEEAVLFCAAISLMPFVLFAGLRGWTGSALFLLLLLTIILAGKRPILCGIVWSLAILTKPFAIGLLPLLLFLIPNRRDRLKTFITSFAIVGVYFLVEYLQAGHLIIGAHAELDPTNAFHGPVRILLNLAHALQILFSVHNYYYPVPALTGPGNLMHTTPILIFLALYGIFSAKEFFNDSKLPRALFFGALIVFGMNALLDHMDHFYMEVGILLLIIAAMPVLVQRPLWIPLALLTLHFQWFYFFLQNREVFSLGWPFFTLPVFADLLFLIWCGFHWRQVWGRLQFLVHD